MIYEYLLLDLMILAGPLSLSFDKRVYFYQHWKSFAKAFALPALVFIVWDSFVAGRHWWFNEAFTLPIRILHLPISEWLFFLVVPYACLFTWQVLTVYFPDKPLPKWEFYPFLVPVFLGSSFIFWFGGKEYTSLVSAALGITVWLDILTGTYLVFRRNFWPFMALISVFTLIFNGYLTARPIVQYDYSYQLKFLIGTIPIEDFFYGFALLISTTILFERFKK